jgi:DNA-binding NarL/FixJ family response regulator
MNYLAEKRIRLILVDDQYLFLESLKLLLTSLAPDFEIIATALNGEDALEKLETMQVDIVLMDVYMPIMDGVAAMKIISKKYPGISVIMLTTFEDDEYVAEALAHGAKGYLLKNIAPQMLISAIRAVSSGSVLMAPNIATSLIQHLKDKAAANRDTAQKNLPDWYYELTQKERGIIKLILRGLSNKEIAAEINVGEQTIRNYVSTIYDKLGVTCRKEAVQITRDLPPFYLEY